MGGIVSGLDDGCAVYDLGGGVIESLSESVSNWTVVGFDDRKTVTFSAVMLSDASRAVMVTSNATPAVWS